ncbi:MAG: glycosyltransferase [Desulfurivibrionaceae bacterium]
MNILHVISGLEQGGAEAILLRLLQNLDRREFSQAVVSLTTEGTHGHAVKESGIPLLSLGMMGFSSIPGGLFKLISAVRKERPHIVQTWLFHADLMGLLAGRMVRDVRVAWNVRCAALAPGDVPWSTMALIKVLSKLSRYPEAVVFNSVVGKEAHKALGYRPRFSPVIPNGFDLEEWQPNATRRAEFRAEIGVVEDDFLVGMAARYHPMKRHSVFLAAAKKLAMRVPNVRFVLVGFGTTWENSALAAEIDRYGLRGRFTLLGARTDMVRIMAGLDCMVSTSSSEGFPNVIGEAMACGIPCVVTDAGDSCLIVGETGKVVAVDDADGVVDGVFEIMTADLAARMVMAKRCRMRIAENFALDRMVARYANFYRELNGHRKC